MNVNDCQLVIEKNTSKGGKEYCALYFVINKQKIFITFINNNIYEKIIAK